MTKKPTNRSRLEEPRGRPSQGRPRLSGATEEDPLVPHQILRVPLSIWTALGEMAAEKTWHRAVLIRQILAAAVAEWKKVKKKAGEGEQAA